MRWRLRLSIASTIGVIAVLVLAAPSGARTFGKCKVPGDVLLLAFTQTAVAFVTDDESGAAYGCLRHVGRRVFLQWTDEAGAGWDIVVRLRLAGKYVAWVE